MTFFGAAKPPKARSRQSRRLAEAIGDDYATVALKLLLRVEEAKNRIKNSSAKGLRLFVNLPRLSTLAGDDYATVALKLLLRVEEAENRIKNSSAKTIGF